jgi:hypothetical protein
MLFKHTIRIVSDSHENPIFDERFEACLVATTTSATVDLYEEQHAMARLVADDAKERIAILTNNGLSIGAAQTKIAVLAGILHRDQNRISSLTNPYTHPDGTRTNPALLHDAYEDLKQAERVLGWKVPVLGSQRVITWCYSLKRAKQALAAYSPKVTECGDSLEIRTDIEIERFKEPRA